jgi:hypothetical protein
MGSYTFIDILKLELESGTDSTKMCVF